jgi:thiamine pyrophosphate-dependent acetolactate synthase large subunit-like protein
VVSISGINEEKKEDFTATGDAIVIATGGICGGDLSKAAENAFKDSDCLLAVGTRFSEIPTGSFGAVVPENLIHVDINQNVFHKNYPAKIVLGLEKE